VILDWPELFDDLYDQNCIFFAVIVLHNCISHNLSCQNPPLGEMHPAMVRVITRPTGGLLP